MASVVNPPKLYFGNFQAQTVSIDYSSCIPNEAQQIELLMFVASGGVTRTQRLFFYLEN